MRIEVGAALDHVVNLIAKRVGLVLKYAHMARYEMEDVGHVNVSRLRSTHGASRTFGQGPDGFAESDERRSYVELGAHPRLWARPEDASSVSDGLWQMRCVGGPRRFLQKSRFFGAIRVSVARRQTRIVYDAFIDLVGAGKSRVDTGAVAAYMRERDHPMDAWEIRGEFFQLQQMGLIDLDADTAQWFSIPGRDFESAQAAMVGDGTAETNGQAEADGLRFR